ncbi:MAG: AAA family ATPase [Muribaculaceae bacterium]|nr:AAA family ATPase [Muribaculaceae bacterium]
MKSTNIDNAWPSLPICESGVKAFLSSKAVEGIGKVYAEKLVKEYGTDAVTVLRDNPECITGISGLGDSRIAAASESLRQMKRPIDLILFLYSCGINEMFIDRIIGKYGTKTKEIVLEDPYKMVEEVWRLSFFIADKIGKALGIAFDDPRRLRGALLTAIKHYAENGHLFATPVQAVDYAAGITGADKDKIVASIKSLEDKGRIIASRGGLYLPVYYAAERNGARRLMQLASTHVAKSVTPNFPEYDIEGHKYTALQQMAMAKALMNPVTILTGGPGSGKTTVLKGILDYFKQVGLKITLVAPTGRAAKRMTALTGYHATTIHHLLGYRQGEGYHNKSIDTDLLVIDEGSMMEQVMFDHLLEAVKPGTRIIMVGDVNQLPAIGAGDVMRDMIKSGVVPVAILDENFRQEEGSLIAANARAINRGEMPEQSDEDSFILIEEKGDAAIRNRIISLVSKEMPAKYSITPAEIMVVTPQQMGPLGARQLNIELQKSLNADAPGIKRGATLLKLGDPVMHTANSRERELYNGETGVIVEVDPNEMYLVVEFKSGKKSKYLRSELSELTLAYATTVHKLQGSEVDYLVMPVSMSHRPMLYRNLLYTGVTRARKGCVLVGEDEAIRYAIDNQSDVRRNSNFGSRLITYHDSTSTPSSVNN